MALRMLNQKILSKITPLTSRYLSHYPIDEHVFGLSEEQQEVILILFIYILRSANIF